MTTSIKKPAANAKIFLERRWNLYMAGWYKVAKMKLPFKISSEEVAKPIQESFRKDVKTARGYWGDIEINTALGEMGFNLTYREEHPYVTGWHIRQFRPKSFKSPSQ